jgi:hypothetical protein
MAKCTPRYSVFVFRQIEARFSVRITVSAAAAHSMLFVGPRTEVTINCAKDFYAVFAPST